MTLKLYVQSFVLPYLEAQGITRHLDQHDGNPYTTKINELLTEIKQYEATICRKMPKHRYDLQPYVSSLELTINPELLPQKTYKNIVAQSYLTIQFSKYIKKQICQQFTNLLNTHHQGRKFSISKVIELFYQQTNLNEDLFSSQILRKYHTRSKGKLKRIE